MFSRFSFPASIFEIRMSLISEAVRLRILSRSQIIALLGIQLGSQARSVMPIIPFIGVRISWLMFAGTRSRRYVGGQHLSSARLRYAISS
jgi:hypothetical protein